MSLEAALSVSVFAAVMGIWGGAAVSTFIERHSGAETAERFNTPILMGSVILVLLTLAVGFLLSYFNVPAFDRAWVIFVLLNGLAAGVVGGGLIYIVWKRWQLTAESVLLDAGRDIHFIRLLIGGYFLLILLDGLVDELKNNAQNWETFSVNIAPFVLFGVALIALLISSCAKVYFLEEGISLFRLTTIKWDQIRDYMWSVRNANKVSLILKEGRRVEFSITGKSKERVEEILQAKIKGREMILAKEEGLNPG